MTVTGRPTTAVTTGAVRGRDGDIPVRDYIPAHQTSRRPLLWIHGGGFTDGSLDLPESDSVAHALAARGRRVRTVAYRLVPRTPFVGKERYKPSNNRFPAPLDDVIDSFTDLDTGDGAPMIGGASAGACLAAAATLRLRDLGASLPHAAVIAYGTYHAELPPLSDEIRSRATGMKALFQFSASMVHRMNVNFVGTDEGMAGHQAFPGGGDLHGFPPTLMLDADRDTLRASGESFARELERYGTAIEHETVPRTRHGFLNRPKTAGFTHGIERIATWLNRYDA